MSGRLFDTSVLLDIRTADATWVGWSEGQLRAAGRLGPVLLNPIIYAELAPAFATQAELDGWLDPAVFQRCRCRMQRDGGRRGRLSPTVARAARSPLRSRISKSARTRRRRA